MSGSNTNTLTNPAVSASGKVDSLLIEKFNGKVHEQYIKGENLLGYFDVEDVVGTNMVSNKYFGETELQKLIPGQEPEAKPTETDKNALVVDTIVLARNTSHTFHEIQNDFETKSKIANNQMMKLKKQEDEMVITQLLLGALTGGSYNPYDGSFITGGTSRLSGHGVAIKTDITVAQAQDPYRLVAAIELCVMGMIIQDIPVGQIRVIVPVEEFGTLVDFGFVTQQQGGSGVGTEMSTIGNLRGMLKSVGCEVIGSAAYTQMKIKGPHSGTDHSLLSNASNSYRYDITQDMVDSHAVVFRNEGLLCGRTITAQGDIFFDKKTKSWFVDSWYSEGAVPDRYDNLAMVGHTAVTNTVVEAKAKAKVTRTIAEA